MPRGGGGMRNHRALWVLYLSTSAVAVIAFFATPAWAHPGDGVGLLLEAGPGVGELTLDWTGGQPTFEVFRSPDPATILDPGNSLGTTGGNTWSDTPPPGDIYFFQITSPCVVNPPEICDGVDNDCNGTIDDPGAEDFCSLSNATPVCVAGNCEVDTCDAGFDDCDLDPGTGCEADLGTDLANCGACAAVCAPANATGDCLGGQCDIFACDEGFEDCDTDTLTGCELFTDGGDINNCGGCGVVCAPANATGDCAAGECNIAACDAEFENCDNDSSTGCEISTVSDVGNCGGCGIICSLSNATAGCAASACFVASCNAGFVDANGAAVDGCECTFLGSDLPDAAFLDQNCDGIDGDISRAVFVSPAPAGNNANPGTMAAPVETLTHALTLTTAGIRDQVLVDAGIYTESVTLKDGIGIYGGYDRLSGWIRSATLSAQIMGGTTAVTATNLTATTVVDLLSIQSQGAVAPGTSSYGILASNSSGLVVRDSAIVAGQGAAGIAGSNGSTGSSGGNGSRGNAGCEDGGILCNTCGVPGGGNGGTSACGRSGGRGGAPRSGSSGGITGSTGAGGTSGGPGTPPGQSNWNTPSTFWGRNGAPGSPGPNSAPGAPLYVATGYSPVNGATGGPGSHGNGGGGGGGGGGGTTACDSYGGRGGGGGAGGCGGNPSGGGTSAGGSFAIYLGSSDALLENLQLTTSSGGNGGNAGNPGGGGVGGVGGNCSGSGRGNCYGGSGEQDDGSNGGRGGAGGAGGEGGAGGGGAGGPSICVVQGGGSAPTLAGNNCANGPGGAGGSSSGNVGPGGLSTAVHTP